MVDRPAVPGAPRPRLVLLGASNLTLSFATALRTAENLWQGPVEVLAADGHGRSYGTTTRVLGRTLPGILQCGLWDALDQLPPAPTAGVVTDVGNDLVYGVPVPRIVDWVGQCLDRLAAHGSRTIVTGLPLDSLKKVPPLRYLVLRTITFPSSRLKLPKAVELAEELNARLEALARERDAVFVPPVTAWYGFDPIHVRFGSWPLAWQEVLSFLRPEKNIFPARASLFRALRIYLCRPQYRRLFGLEQRRAQPVLTFNGGTSVSLY